MSDVAITDGGTARCGPSWTSGSWIDEPCLKIYAVESGGGAYAVRGQSVALAAGHLYLIPPGRHRYGPADGMLVHWLHLRVLSPAIARRIAAAGRIAVWPAADWAWWRATWRGIAAWLADPQLAGELRLHAFATAVLAEAVSAGPGAPAIDPRLDAARRWMDAHALEHPPLAAVARVAGLAPAVLHRRFAAAFGMTPRAWLEARRLDHARRLLREPGASVQAVAAACGYANAFHFSRVVRRRLGSSPSAIARRPGP